MPRRSMGPQSAECLIVSSVGSRHPDTLFEEYYNSDRVRRELEGIPPDETAGYANRQIAHLDAYHWQKRCRGLFHLPVAA